MSIVSVDEELRSVIIVMKTDIIWIMIYRLMEK